MKAFKAKLDALRARCLAVTCAASAPPPAGGGALPSASPLQLAFQRIWKTADFGCQTVHVAQLLRVLLEAETGEKVVFSEKGRWAKYTYPLYAAVVPLVPESAHSYPLNRPFLVAEKGDWGQAYGGWREAGQGKGNNHWGIWRYATEAEINELFDDFASHRGATEPLLRELQIEEEK